MRFFLQISLFVCLCTAPLLAGCDGGSDTTGGVGGGGGSGGAGGSGGSGGASAADELAATIATIPGITITSVTETSKGVRVHMTFEQPADHNDPQSPTFPQRLSLLHKDPAAPMVLQTAGYGLSTKEREPTLILDANQLSVEHRFFTPSRPDPADWGHLRIWQAATDHHLIVEAFKPLYTGKWLSTGASKGGMASVYHRRFYPDDVEATIAYVAPQSYGEADPRYIDFLQNVGDPACRDALTAFQIEVLTRRAEMTSRMIAQDGDMAYSYHGADGALDFAVTELPFTFWQYDNPSNCVNIPSSASTDDEVWAFLESVVSPLNWGDESFYAYEPYYFQAAVELGYPGYDNTPLDGLLTIGVNANVAVSQVKPEPTKDMVLDPNAMLDIADWLGAQGERMLFIYGENDPYSAAAFEPGGAKDSYIFFVAGENHGALISDLPDADKAIALEALQTWAGVTPQPLPPETVSDLRKTRLERAR